MCRALLWAAAISATVLVPTMGKALPPVIPTEHRVIVRFADAVVGGSNSGDVLDQKVQSLLARAGIMQAKALKKLGMAVVVCDSQDVQEQLLEDLGVDPAVELAVPDTWVTAADLGVHSTAGSNPDKVQTPMQSLAATDMAVCSAHPACAARGLAGSCCPSRDGTMLSCCSAMEPARVALKTYHGTYISAAQSGIMTATTRVVQPTSTFSIIIHEDGKVSLRSSFGQYVSADSSGAVVANRARVGSWEKFDLARNQNGTVSLKSHFNMYLTAEPTGGVFANRPRKSSWEHFVVVHEPSPKQRFPNDPSFQYLWGMNNYAKHDIDAPEAWKTWTGEIGAGITLAVIDTGIDYNHPDLKGQVWVNPYEIPGNGIDDDNNGYIDDIHGADFANEDGDPMDDNMHGTHCSGTIAGIGNNGIGVAGVAWRGVRLMGLKFLTSTGSGKTSDSIKAIDYAMANGAKIASNSWGGGGSNSALRVAIERAEAAGLLFIAAAGNSASNNDEEPQYPSNYEVDNIIAVASTTVGGDLSSFSCYGEKTVDVAAPGSNIYSTVPGGSYQMLSGTSMATPHVAGLAALVWTYRPQLSMHQVKQIILSSVKRQDSLVGLVATGGLINAKNALETAWAFQPPLPPAHGPRGLEFQDLDSRVGAMGGTVTITAAADESDVEYYRVYFVSGAGFQLAAVGDALPATGQTEYTVQLNGSFATPEFARALVAVTGRASGEQPAIVASGAPKVDLVDYGVPEMEPRSVRWSGDTDLRQGFVKGTITIGRAADEASISAYNLYWRRADGSRGDKLGSVGAIGFQEPSCSGTSCELINETKGQDSTYTFMRLGYTDEESATIAASGPALVTVTRFDTENYYDWLSIGTSRVSGSLAAGSLPMQLALPEGPAKITWSSDTSVTGRGWSFELHQNGSAVDFEVRSTALQGNGFEVVPAYGTTEMPEGIVVAVEDYTTSMPPSPAYTPLDLEFIDLDMEAGEVAGSALFRTAEGADDGGVTYYNVGFGDAAGNPVGASWTSAAPPSANSNSWLNVTIPLTSVPLGAVTLRACAGNAHGLGNSFASVVLVDASFTANLTAQSSADDLGRPSGHVIEVVEGVVARAHGSTEQAAGRPPMLESWLRQPEDEAEPEEVASAVWSAGPMAVPSEAAGSRLRSSLTIPGLEASVAAREDVRAAFARVLAAELPLVAAGDVRVLRVLAASGAAAARVARGGRQLSEAVKRSLSQHAAAALVEFEVSTPAHGPAGALDKAEARLILLSQGGGAAARFDKALMAELLATGALPPGAAVQRTRVREPQELGPKLLHWGTPPASAGRKLEGVAVDTLAEEGTQEEVVGAASLASMASVSAVAAIAAALLFSFQRHLGEKHAPAGQTAVGERPESLLVVQMHDDADDTK